VLAIAFSDELYKEGVFCTAIGYPTVPKGKARVRTIVTAAHTREDLEITLERFARAGRKLRVI